MKLCVENLSISFDKQLILNHIDFQIRQGEFVALLGPSGCGKSTILNILAGLLSKETGIIKVDNQEIKGLSDHFAYMPQSDLLLSWKTILDNVTLYGQINHDSKAKENALKEFKTFGLDGYQNSYPDRKSVV